MLKFNIITATPQLFQPHFDNLPFKKAISKNLITTNVVNLRDFALDSYGTIDDKPYGGGVGMVLMIEPIYEAIVSIYPEMTDIPLNEFKTQFSSKYLQHKIIVLDPKGITYNQTIAKDLCTLTDITFICGRYEGIDQRVLQYLATDVISVGDYILSGGELPTLTIMETITRLLPGVLEKPEASQLESFTQKQDEVEYPQYTRPEIFKDTTVPAVLLSGDHKKITLWKESNKIRV